MAEIKVTRTGHVTYLAGHERNRFEIGYSPVYLTARVEELDTETIIYYPPTAAARTTDGGCKLPAELVDKVVWDS